ncbi:Cupin domain-containing protein [Solirubrobacter pauli]|uniref:Cupin domain-containing protein n=2 Tax=Solirubrobacter pauli TaxID=166793 RepID=A0A660L147_9ACTN|nr:Cupin domain-containing protein [Solirubrobacter pauli]
MQVTPEGQVPLDGGWFVANLGRLAWESAPGFGTWRDFNAPDADPDGPGIGVHVHVFQPGESNGYYHEEDAQEGFLVLSGECVAVVEGEERRMRQWDYFHSPPGTAHITVGAGDEPCAILMFGSPDPRRAVTWIANATAARYGASVERTTTRDSEAYGDLPAVRRVPARRPFGPS